MKPLPAPIVTAAQRISAQALKQGLSFADLRKTVAENPVAVWHEWATFHLRETVDFGDKQEVYHIATLRGCEQALEKGLQMLVFQRALDQPISVGKTQRVYQLVLEVPNKVNGLSGWLDCETGRLERPKTWPTLMESMKEERS